MQFLDDRGPWRVLSIFGFFHLFEYFTNEKNYDKIYKKLRSAYLDDEQLMEIQLPMWKFWDDARLLLEIAKARVGRHPEIDKMVAARERVFLVQRSSTKLFTFADYRNFMHFD